MATFDWESHIREWSRKRIEALDDEQKAELPLEVQESGWLGYPGATEEQIANAEARLGVTFPPSYREFLLVSNGCRSLSRYAIRFYSTEEVDWFAVRNQDWIDAWQVLDPVPDEKYLVYGEEQDCIDIRPEYMQTALEISSDCDGYIYLLNPKVITADGEWEAWDFGSKLPGAYRYRSFRELMEYVFNNPDMIA